MKTGNLWRPGRGIKTKSDIAEVARFNAGAVAEGMAHPVANFEPFLDNSISAFNAVKMAKAATASGIVTKLATMSHDSYFPRDYYIREAVAQHLDAHVLIPIPGEHDELPLRPEQTIARYQAVLSVTS